jgi:TorA maturation chaperone TorD
MGVPPRLIVRPCAVWEAENRARRGKKKDNQVQVDAVEDLYIADQEDMIRARFYALLSRLLSAPPSGEALAELGALSGDETPIGSALGALGEAARAADPAAVDDEYHSLFIGGGQGGEICPFASHYLTGFLNERPLADLRGTMMEFGIEASGTSKEPEDGMVTVTEIMHGLITGAYGEPAGLESQRDFFLKHLQPWATDFFTDLETADAARLYAPVGTLGRVFMKVESEGFALST